MEGEHTVTAKDRNHWGGTGSDGKLTPTSDALHQEVHDPRGLLLLLRTPRQLDEDNNLKGMWGFIRVNGPADHHSRPPPRRRRRRRQSATDDHHDPTVRHPAGDLGHGSDDPAHAHYRRSGADDDHRQAGQEEGR